MRQPPSNPKQSFSSSEKTQILIVVLLLGILLVVLGILLGTVLKRNGFQFSIQDLLTQPTSTNTPILFSPAVSIPISNCGIPTLAIGSTTFQVQPIQFAPDGTLPVPADGFGIAYWLNGTNTNPVFALSPSQDNYSLISTLPVGTAASVIWPNCDSTTYYLSFPEQGVFNASTLPDQSLTGILIFFQMDSTGNGYSLRGILSTEQTFVNAAPSPTPESSVPLVAVNTLPPTVQILPSPIVINTSPPTVEYIPPPSGDVLAEITLLETNTLPDGTSIRIGVSILNYGSNAFTLSANDVGLTPEGGTPLAMISSEPALPRGIGAGETATLYFTFPRPASPTATLHILMVEYDIDEY